MSDMKEGFLCPICMTDLGDVIQLQVHFEGKHSKEDPAFVQNLKDLFGKAKKILNKEIGDDAVANAIKSLAQESGADENKYSIFGTRAKDYHPVSGMHFKFNESYDDPPMMLSSHFDYFKRERSKRVDRVAMDTNKLIIRLDKLLHKLPSDPVKRKAHEQSVVPWMPEDVVKLCPDCARSFNLVRRKHHCRLCGSVLCDDCSEYVSFDFARKVINPATISKYNPTESHLDPTNGGEDGKSNGSQNNGLMSKLKLKRSGSRESLMSLVDSKINEQQFRCCKYCKLALNQRDDQVEQAISKPILVQFYERLRQHMTEGMELSEEYRKMANSLNEGRTDYKLDDAKYLRLKLLKLAENVDIMSKKINVLGAENPDPPVGSELTLQHRIRMASVNFVRDSLVGLPSVPRDDEYEDLKRRRLQEAAKRVEEEKRTARLAKLKYEQDSLHRSSARPSPSSSASKRESAVVYEKGFVLSSSDSYTTSDDPMVQQMNIIRGYIQQAREANRFDEVRMLEANLKDLQLEFQKMQQEQREADEERRELEDNYLLYKNVFKSSREESEDLDPDNPFFQGDEVEEEEDEYDASGKNPFA